MLFTWIELSFMTGFLQVTFHYIGYNESGRRIDSTYIQGSPARIRMGTNALVPGKLKDINLPFNSMMLMKNLL